MTNVAWEMTHSIETEASLDFAWNYWTTVTNWDDPPAQFELDGPFAAGSRGTTRMPRQEPMHWLIREVNPRHSATIEFQLDGAVLSFEWRFDPVTTGRTRLSQRVSLQGEHAATFRAQVESTFTSSLPGGMKKLASAIAEAAAKDKNRGRV
jgi:polyketide cyclase/dehydrase/lipid transport protein